MITIHKANYEDKVEAYQGFGRYRRIPTTVCRGGKGYYSKRPPRGYVVRNWKDVTCKNCLRHAPKPIAAQQADCEAKQKNINKQNKV